MTERLSAVSEDDEQEFVEFVFGNALHVLFHEAGHLLITAFEIPVLGREEDAVDNLATLLLLDLETEEADWALMDTADGFFLADDAAAEAGEDFAFFGQHGLDQQRAFQIVCLMVGKDSETFGEIADAAGLPADRQANCADDYRQASQSWQRQLSPHSRAEGAGAAPTSIIYGRPPEELALTAEIVRAGELLELVGSAVRQAFVLPWSYRLRAAQCGEPNAFWDPEVREITFGYELADFYGRLILDDIERR